MEGSDVLLAISEISIAFVGFTSIVAVLGRRGAGIWAAEDSFRLWLMIESSLATLFFCLVPFAFHYLGADDETIWVVSSSAMAVFLVVHMVIVGPRLLRLARQGNWTTRRFEPFISLLILSTLSVQTLNAVGIGFAGSFGAYLLGLILFLGLAAMHFVALMAAIRRPDREP